MPLSLCKFNEIDLSDPFFDSLRNDYKGFDKWFESKKDESAYIFKNHSGFLDGFLYLKIETGVVSDVIPEFGEARRLKIGTFKINAHGTKLGERFVKKVFDNAIYSKVDEIYVTAFDKYEPLISLLKKYGFVLKAKKETVNGIESVFVKSMVVTNAVGIESYPFIQLANKNIYMLSLYPVWHTRLLPDSILKSEESDIVQDISHSNSIHKVYLAAMKGIERLHEGDVILIYRTSDNLGPAHYRSVVTSVCVVEQYVSIHSFKNVESFIEYCRPYTVFTNDELKDFWNTKKYPHVIRFSYNIALKKRVTRGEMIEEFGFDGGLYWGFMPVTKDQFRNVIKKGRVDESLIVD